MNKVMKNRKYCDRRGSHRNPETCAATVAVCPIVINHTAMAPKGPLSNQKKPENHPRQQHHLAVASAARTFRPRQAAKSP